MSCTICGYQIWAQGMARTLDKDSSLQAGHVAAQFYPGLEYAGQLACIVSSAELEVAAMQLRLRGFISPYSVSHSRHPYGGYLDLHHEIASQICAAWCTTGLVRKGLRIWHKSSQASSAPALDPVHPLVHIQSPPIFPCSQTSLFRPPTTLSPCAGYPRPA